MNIFFTCFLVGYVPNYFYIWYTGKAVVLLSYRWYTYKQLGFHYFLFDFCYFTNVLILIYLWLPSSLLGDYWRGALFVGIFSFSFGPLLSGILLWRNSLVPHSTDKMTSLFIHISPVMALWGIRWFSTEEQGFPLCSEPTVPGPRGCDHVTMTDAVYVPIFLYAMWQIMYIVVIFIWRKEKVSKKKYSTSYTWMVERSKLGFMNKIYRIFGEKYQKPMFVFWQLIYTIVSMLPVKFYFHNTLLGVFVGSVVMTFACYNGASFYIDVFSQRYYFEKVLKIPASQKPTGQTEMYAHKKN
ncbi:uncharacterized protein LOC135344976 isoform X2 [Halichondria panicea]